MTILKAKKSSTEKDISKYGIYVFNYEEYKMHIDKENVLETDEYFKAKLRHTKMHNIYYFAGTSLEHRFIELSTEYALSLTDLERDYISRYTQKSLNSLL